MTTSGWEIPIPDGNHTSRGSAFADSSRWVPVRSFEERKARRMLAAIGFGLIGTVLVVTLVIAALLFVLRRA